MLGIFQIQEKTHEDLVYTYIVKSVGSTQNLKVFKYLLTVQRLDIKFWIDCKWADWKQVDNGLENLTYYLYSDITCF